MPTEPSTSDAQYWIALSLVNGLGAATFCQLLLHFKTPDAILQAPYTALRDVVSKDIAEAIQQAPDDPKLATTLDWLALPDNHLITLADRHYPKRLLEIDQPPPVLYAKGNLQVLNRPGLALSLIHI